MGKSRHTPGLTERLLALMVASGCWNAQCTWAAAQSAPESRMVVGADEVVVDLVVRDKKGNLVLNLKPEELEITDDGLPVKIKDLRLASGEAEKEDATNVNQAHPVRLVSMVFEHLGNEAARLARETAGEMLKADAAANVYFAVLSVDRRMRLIQPYVTDRARVRQAVEAATFGARSHSNFDAEAAERTLLGAGHSADSQQRLLGGDSSAGTTGPGASFAPMMIKTLEDSDRMARDQQSRPSLAGLLALARQQGTLPGRKAIVYFCEGLPLTAGTKEALHSLVAAANRANVSVYTVDVSGLSLESRTEAGREMLASAAQASRDMTALTPNANVSSPGRGGAAAIPAGGPVTPADPAANRIRAIDRASDAIVSDAQASLIDLAKRTGGFYIGDSNDLRKPARKLIQDIATYYEASYTPEGTKYDGRFHPIVVRVKRPSTTVQARNGYVAVPPGMPPDVQPFEAGLLKCFTGRELPRQLDFHAEVVPFGREGDGVAASLVVEIPLRQLEFREDANAGVFEVRPVLLALLKSQQGEVVRKFSEDLPRRGALDAKERMRDGAYTMQRSFTAKPGTFVLEVAIGDGLNGKVSAQRSTVTIPAAPAGAWLSGISLVRRAEALPESQASSEPFRYRNTKIIPNLERTISREQTQPVPAFFVVYPDEKLKDSPKLNLELSRRGQPVARVPMELKSDSKGAIPYVISIPTASLRPGPYDLTAILTQGGEQAKQATSFLVEGTEPPPIDAVRTGSAPGHPGNVETQEPADVSALTNEDAVASTHITISRIENVARPDAEEQKRILEAARLHSIEYESSLPNFICIQVTHRWRAHGQNKWQAKDAITEMLRYLDGKEVRRVLEVNGVKATRDRGDLHGMLASGEFGGLLNAVFGEEAKAAFEWKELASLGNQTCHVYSYRIDARNSTYALGATLDSGDKRIVGFHGLAYIDAARYVVRRISAETDVLPPSFPVRQSSIWVNYDIEQIGEREHVLPASAEVLARTGRHTTVRNEITFRDYRLFGAESSIRFGSE